MVVLLVSYGAARGIGAARARRDVLVPAQAAG